jgi:hypothetical protein
VVLLLDEELQGEELQGEELQGEELQDEELEDEEPPVPEVVLLLDEKPRQQ